MDKRTIIEILTIIAWATVLIALLTHGNSIRCSCLGVEIIGLDARQGE